MFAVLKEMHCGTEYVHEEYAYFIRRFREEWRHDRIMTSILLAMTLFNPDGMPQAMCDKSIRYVCYDTSSYQ